MKISIELNTRVENYLYSEFIKACESEGYSPSSWAEQNGLSASTISNLKNGVRPSQDTLSKLTGFWKGRKTATLLFRAYLKDEIERTGFSLDEIEPVIKGEAPDTDLASALRKIEYFMKRLPNLREAMLEMASLLELAEKTDSPVRQPEDGAKPKRRARPRKNPE